MGGRHENGNGREMHVLIVQSKEPLAQLWQRHLERLGSEVVVAASGDEAVELIENSDFDVIVREYAHVVLHILRHLHNARVRQDGRNYSEYVV